VCGTNYSDKSVVVANGTGENDRCVGPGCRDQRTRAARRKRDKREGTRVRGRSEWTTPDQLKSPYVSDTARPADGGRDGPTADAESLLIFRRVARPLLRLNLRLLLIRARGPGRSLVRGPWRTVSFYGGRLDGRARARATRTDRTSVHLLSRPRTAAASSPTGPFNVHIVHCTTNGMITAIVPLLISRCFAHAHLVLGSLDRLLLLFFFIYKLRTICSYAVSSAVIARTFHWTLNISLHVNRTVETVDALDDDVENTNDISERTIFVYDEHVSRCSLNAV